MIPTMPIAHVRGKIPGMSFGIKVSLCTCPWTCYDYLKSRHEQTEHTVWFGCLKHEVLLRQVENSAGKKLLNSAGACMQCLIAFNVGVQLIMQQPRFGLFSCDSSWSCSFSMCASNTYAMCVEGMMVVVYLYLGFQLDSMGSFFRGLGDGFFNLQGMVWTLWSRNTIQASTKRELGGLTRAGRHPLSWKCAPYKYQSC